MDTERLQKDKAKYEKELEIATDQLRIAQVNIQRLSGALSYINLLLKEEVKKE